ncbi:MAG: hypothetical protein PHY92_04745 [Alphaproteobacteria bacterium]|nr:hypothetical protein [Alphaproteobacteria bacterium]
MQNDDSLRRENRKPLILVFVGLCFLIFYNFGFILTTIYDLSDQHIIKRSALRDDIKIGEVVPLKKLAPNLAGTVCVIYPYGRNLSFVSEDIMSKVNPILEREGFSLGEGEWAFVFINNEDVDLARYHLYKDLGIQSFENLHDLQKIIPSGFEPTKCVEIEQAGLFKAFIYDRPSLMLGRIK